MTTLISFKEYLLEVFDTPYPFTLKKRSRWDYVATVNLPDNTILHIEFFFQAGDEWSISFSRGGSRGKTDQGDQMKILATVLAAIKEFLQKENNPEKLTFVAEKDKGSKRGALTSREKLYSKLIKRFAKDAGYSSNEKTNSLGTQYHLVKVN